MMMSHGSECLHVCKSDPVGLSLSSPYICDLDQARLSEHRVLMPVFKLGSSLESWGLSLLLFQSVWVCWLLCWIKWPKCLCASFLGRGVKSLQPSFPVYQNTCPGRSQLPGKKSDDSETAMLGGSSRHLVGEVVWSKGCQPVIPARCQTCEEKPSGDSSFRWEASP